jgi:hypothetical protein
MQIYNLIIKCSLAHGLAGCRLTGAQIFMRSNCSTVGFNFIPCNFKYVTDIITIYCIIIIIVLLLERIHWAYNILLILLR